MNKDEVLRKAENGEGLTVEEIKLYQSIVINLYFTIKTLHFIALFYPYP